MTLGKLLNDQPMDQALATYNRRRVIRTQLLRSASSVMGGSIALARGGAQPWRDALLKQVGKRVAGAGRRLKLRSRFCRYVGVNLIYSNILSNMVSWRKEVRAWGLFSESVGVSCTDAGQPREVQWKGTQYTVTNEPVRWYERRQWWLEESRAPPLAAELAWLTTRSGVSNSCQPHLTQKPAAPPSPSTWSGT